MVKLPAVLMSLTLTSTGCLPFHLQDTPHLAGTVTTRSPQQPVAGAKLYYVKFPKEAVWTSASGQFDFPPLYHWHVMPLAPVDRFDREYLLVEATNCHTAHLEFSHWGEETNRMIYLEPR